MDPFTEKFKSIRLSDTPLGVVEDIIFEKYREICKNEIYQFKSSHFVCSMCNEWCCKTNCRGEHKQYKEFYETDIDPFNVLEMCDECRYSYVVLRCKHCKHDFNYDRIAMIECTLHRGRVNLEHLEPYCHVCYNERIDFKCSCGRIYKLCDGHDELYCSNVCYKFHKWDW